MAVAAKPTFIIVLQSDWRLSIEKACSHWHVNINICLDRWVCSREVWWRKMEGLLLNRKSLSRFSPASRIHGELKVVETNKKGSCCKKWIPQEGTKILRNRHADHWGLSMVHEWQSWPCWVGIMSSLPYSWVTKSNGNESEGVCLEKWIPQAPVYSTCCSGLAKSGYLLKSGSADCWTFPLGSES